MERTGECHCGALKVIASGEPDRTYLCHCQACQRRTGTAFHHGTRWRKEQVRAVGEEKIYARMADSGFVIRFHFCPNCGSNLYWEGDRAPEFVGIAVGAFADPNFPAPTASIWEESLHRWLGLDRIGEHFDEGFPAAPSPGT